MAGIVIWLVKSHLGQSGWGHGLCQNCCTVKLKNCYTVEAVALLSPGYCTVELQKRLHHHNYHTVKSKIITDKPKTITPLSSKAIKIVTLPRLLHCLDQNCQLVRHFWQFGARQCKSVDNLHLVDFIYVWLDLLVYSLINMPVFL